MIKRRPERGELKPIGRKVDKSGKIDGIGVVGIRMPVGSSAGRLE
jgi:hypothetical protein